MGLAVSVPEFTYLLYHAVIDHNIVLLLLGFVTTVEGVFIPHKQCRS